MEHSIFLCHSSGDKPFVKMIAKKLEKEGINVWIDEAEILPGDSIITKIDTGIRKTRFFLAFISENSIKAGWVNFELERALTGEINKETLVIPAKLGEYEIPSILRHKNYADFSDFENIDDEVARIVKQIQTHEFDMEKIEKEQRINDDDDNSSGNALVEVAQGIVGLAEAYQSLKQIFGKSDSEKSNQFYAKGANNYMNFYFDDAIKNLDKAIQYDDNNYKAHNLLAWILACNRKQLSVALAHAKKALQLQPNEGYLYGTLSEVYCANGDYDKVFQTYNEALEKCEILSDKTKYTFYYRLGRCYYQMGTEHTDAAINCFNAALELKQNDTIWDLASLYYSLSLCFIRKNDKKTALLLIDNAINKRKYNFFKETRKQILNM